jgi:hypothetical protein
LEILYTLFVGIPLCLFAVTFGVQAANRVVAKYFAASERSRRRQRR